MARVKVFDKNKNEWVYADKSLAYIPIKDVDYFDGKDGNGIKSAVLNADYTLTITFDDGTSYTTPSIRGATGAAPVKGTDYFTDAEKTEMVAQVKTAMPTLTVTGIDENGVSHTWLMYGVSQE